MQNSTVEIEMWTSGLRFICDFGAAIQAVGWVTPGKRHTSRDKKRCGTGTSLRGSETNSRRRRSFLAIKRRHYLTKYNSTLRRVRVMSPWNEPQASSIWVWGNHHNRKDKGSIHTECGAPVNANRQFKH